MQTEKIEFKCDNERCDNKLEYSKRDRIGSSPLGWIHVRNKDGNTYDFCCYKCLSEWSLSLVAEELGDIEKANKFKREWDKHLKNILESLPGK